MKIFYRKIVQYIYLTTKIKCDKQLCSDYSRNARIPLTYNNKKGNKKQVKILSESMDNLISLDYLKKTLKDISYVSVDKINELKGKSIKLDLNKLNKIIPVSILEKSSELRYFLEQQKVSVKDDSESGLDFALAIFLKWKKLNINEVYSILNNYRYQHNVKGKQRENYLKYTVSKIFSMTKEQIEEIKVVLKLKREEFQRIAIDGIEYKVPYGYYIIYQNDFYNPYAKRYYVYKMVRDKGNYVIKENTQPLSNGICLPVSMTNDYIENKNYIEFKIFFDGRYSENEMFEIEVMTNIKQYMARELVMLGVTPSKAQNFSNFLNEFFNANLNIVTMKKAISNLGYLDDKFTGFALPTKIISNQNDIAKNYQLNKIADWSDMYCKSKVYNEDQEIEKYKIAKRKRYFSFLQGAVMVSPLLKMLNLNSFVISVYGDSSHGKTLMTQVCMSMFANPQKLKQADATKNSIIADIASINCLPVFIDEITNKLATQQQRKELETLAYTISGGVERGRLDVTGKQRRRRTWQTGVFFTGEVDLASLNEFSGNQVRIFSLPIFTAEWSNEEVIRMKELMFDNYGYVGEMIIETIYSPKFDIELLKSNIKKKYSSFLKRRDVINTMSERKVLALANIETTVEYLLLITPELNKFFDLDLHKKEIDLLLKNANKLQTVVQRTYSKIKNWIDSNIGNFYYKHTDNLLTDAEEKHNQVVNKIYGVMYLNIPRVFILKSVLKKVFCFEQKADFEVVIKGWEKQGYIIGHHDRFRVDGSVSRRLSEGFIIDLEESPENYKDEEEEEDYEF